MDRALPDDKLGALQMFVYLCKEYASGRIGMSVLEESLISWLGNTRENMILPTHTGRRKSLLITSLAPS